MDILDTEINDIVWSLVLKFIKTSDITTQLNSTKEDLVAEARVAALIAIAKYDAQKGVRLTTFVYECVNNALRNIKKKERHRKAVDFVEELPELDCPAGTEDYDFITSMQSLLTRQEFIVFKSHFVDELPISLVCRKFHIKPREAEQCYNRIMQKYLLLEQTRHRVSTTRTLQSKWLESSRD